MSLPALTSCATDWNQVAPIFDVKKAEGIHPSAADNMLIAWPEIFDQLASFSQATSTVLDFGCGTGTFANKLVEMGHQVLGLDPAEKMVALARQNFAKIPFVSGTVEALGDHLSFDVITAVMVLQFVEPNKIKELLARLLTHLKPGGLFIFAVHNPEFLAAAKKTTKKYFEDASGQLHIQFKEVGQIPLYERRADDYCRILEMLGMKKFRESTPAFTKSYLDQYGANSTEPLNIPKFLICSFIKS